MTKHSHEEIRINYVIRHAQDDDKYTTVSAHWDKNGHPVGLWVRYTDKVSHRYAYSVLQEGVWEALQDPESFNVDIQVWKDHPGRQPPPYATLEEEPDA